MANWIYCTACQQWSKTAATLSDDKSCPYCNKRYTNSIKIHEKPNVSGSGEALIEPETLEISATPVMTETSESQESFDSYETPEEEEISSAQEMPLDLETEVIIEASESTESLESDETPEEHEKPAAQTSSDTPKSKKTPAHRMFIENKRRSSKR